MKNCKIVRKSDGKSFSGFDNLNNPKFGKIGCNVGSSLSAKCQIFLLERFQKEIES